MHRRSWLPLASLWLLACPAPSPPADMSPDVTTDMPQDVDPDASIDMTPDTSTDTGPDLAPVEVRADAGPSRYAIVGEPVTFDGSASTGALRYQWSFGDGEGWEEAREDATATHTFATPGRYKAVLTVLGAGGKRKADDVLITVTDPITHTRRLTSTIAFVPGDTPDTGDILITNEDAAELTRIPFSQGTLGAPVHVATASRPRHLSVAGDRVFVACQGDDVVQEFSLAALTDASAAPAQTFSFGRGARPYAALLLGETLYISLQGAGALARARSPQDITITPWIDEPRGLSALPNGDLISPRWRSPDRQGLVGVYDPEQDLTSTWSLPFDPTPATDTDNGGVPNVLDQALVSPTGGVVAMPSMQANIEHGRNITGVDFEHDTTLRGVVTFAAASDGATSPKERLQFDGRGFASAAAFSSRGDFLFVALRGTRIVERVDVLRRAEAGTIFNVGYAPQGLALTPDDRYLFVDASLSREVRVYDVSDFSVLPTPISTASSVSQEPLSDELLLGKRLFNDSLDARLNFDGYIACAHCHPEGEGDALTWDFTQRGEGLRNTPSLLGRAGTGDGPVHWSANFDEIQDFEHDIRTHQEGTGLMSDADFMAMGRDTPMGGAKAGVSPDLDALAAYVTSLDWHHASPYREPSGELTASAARGKLVFESAETGCTTCHSGARLTDSRLLGPNQPVLYDVGTMTPATGLRLGEMIPGIDTPTLHGVWNTAPYLHDGSAATLRDVLTTRNPDDLHGVTSGLTPSQLDDLIAYLRALEG